jgi:hypothetical protein
MGYDLHITRKESWSDEGGPAISEAEWRRVIEQDAELKLDTESRCTMSDGEYVFASWKGAAGSLGYYNGEITATNPEQPLICKMVSIARRLDASVQGDDGELYDEHGTASEPQSAAPPAGPGGLLSRIQAWFQHRSIVRANQQAAPAFKVGQRVKNPWGVKGVVIAVDRTANGGLGSVRIRLDNGSEHHFAYVASGLEIIDKATGG